MEERKLREKPSGTPCPVQYPDAIEAVRTLLTYIGEDPDREGLKDTPYRVLKSYFDMFSGYAKIPDNNPEKLLKTFEDGAEGYDEMVILRGVEFYSVCEHHFLPFSGKAYIGYIPRGSIVGISKLARLLEVFSRRLQVQERLTVQITKALEENLWPLGSACVLVAKHSCMACRGVKKDCDMITSSLTGVFREKLEVREEFMSLIRS